jgi:hypothetical protein
VSGLLAKVIETLFQGLIGGLGLQTIGRLVFYQGISAMDPQMPGMFDPNAQGAFANGKNLWFPSSLGGPVFGLMNVMMLIAWAVLVAGIVYNGFQLMFSGSNPRKRAELSGVLTRWLSVAFLLTSVRLIATLIFQFDQAFATMFWRTPGDVSLLDTNTTAALSGLTAAILGLVEAGVTIYLNIVYYIRQLTLAILMILAPICIVTTLFDGGKTAKQWVRQLAAEALAHSFHALLLFVIATGFLGWFPKLVLMFVLVPAASSIAKLFNLESSSGVLGAIGMGGVVGIAMLGASTFQGLTGAAAQSGGVSTAGRAAAGAMGAMGGAGSGAIPTGGISTPAGMQQATVGGMTVSTINPHAAGGPGGATPAFSVSDARPNVDDSGLSWMNSSARPMQTSGQMADRMFRATLPHLAASAFGLVAMGAGANPMMANSIGHGLVGGAMNSYGIGTALHDNTVAGYQEAAFAQDLVNHSNGTFGIDGNGQVMANPEAIPELDPNDQRFANPDQGVTVMKHRVMNQEFTYFGLQNGDDQGNYVWARAGQTRAVGHSLPRGVQTFEVSRIVGRDSAGNSLMQSVGRVGQKQLWVDHPANGGADWRPTTANAGTGVGGFAGAQIGTRQPATVAASTVPGYDPPEEPV